MPSARQRACDNTPVTRFSICVSLFAGIRVCVTPPRSVSPGPTRRINEIGATQGLKSRRARAGAFAFGTGKQMKSCVQKTFTGVGGEREGAGLVHEKAKNYSFAWLRPNKCIVNSNKYLFNSNTDSVFQIID